MLDQFYKTPPIYQNLLRAVYELKSRYPVCKVFPIGKSVLGRSIFALSVGPPQGATLMVGATHGQEWLTTLLLIRFFEAVLESVQSGAPLADIDASRAVENRSLIVVPCLNPDGVEIALCGREGAGRLGPKVEKISGGDYSAWQANARGIDLNHNFDAGFDKCKEEERRAGIFGPAPGRYGGESPHSEPESRAIVNLCLSFEVRHLYAFHSQGEEIFYRYGKHTPVRSQLMAQILAASSGYELSRATGTAAHGGLKDWFIDKLHRPGFTIEIGRGKNPLPIEDLEPIYARLLEMMLLAVII